MYDIKMRQVYPANKIRINRDFISFDRRFPIKRFNIKTDIEQTIKFNIMWLIYDNLTLPLRITH